MCSRLLFVVFGTFGVSVQQVALWCVCGTDGGVSVQQVALCCVCGTVGGVSVQQVGLCCMCVCGKVGQ